MAATAVARMIHPLQYKYITIWSMMKVKVDSSIALANPQASGSVWVREVGVSGENWSTSTRASRSLCIYVTDPTR